MRRLPLTLAALLALGVLVTGTLAVAAWTRRVPEASTAETTAAEPARSRALRVLHAWDRRRAEAWQRGSIRRLGALYRPGSPELAADRAMLTAYLDRGLRVVGMRRQTLEVRVLGSDRSRLDLRVTDRLDHAVAVGAGVRQPLPRSGYATRTLRFRRTSGSWVLARIS